VVVAASTVATVAASLRRARKRRKKRRKRSIKKNTKENTKRSTKRSTRETMLLQLLIVLLLAMQAVVLSHRTSAHGTAAASSSAQIALMMLSGREVKSKKVKIQPLVACFNGPPLLVKHQHTYLALRHCHSRAQGE
jgi:anaerobic C4-dicarboxylate transporter